MNPNNKSSTGLSIDEIELRVVKEFLDIIMLIELQANKELSGYDLAILQNQKFRISLSPGTVYATLYNMERRGLITGQVNGKKTTFILTPKGEEAIAQLKKSTKTVKDFLNNIFPNLGL
jgi:DNA-binding PadR family transcriptional regulator